VSTVMHFDEDLGERLIDQKRVCEKIGFSRKWLWQKRRAGEFPPPNRLGKWRMSTVDAWIAHHD